MVAAVLRSPTRLPRLPGVTFHTQPPSRLGLPRLDVAAFVGFAERGPLDLPVPVEDLAGFTAIFGGDVALAQVMEQPTLRDRREETIAVVGGSQARPGGGETLFANLPRAVAAFFANGGRRCYVVRVAGPTACEARFRLPGLVALDGSLSAATVPAASAGRWANHLRLGARLSVTRLATAAFTVEPAGGLIWMTAGTADAIVAGDVLRVTDAGGRRWIASVTALQRRPGRPGERAVFGVAVSIYPVVDSAPAASPLSIARVVRLHGGGGVDVETGAELCLRHDRLVLALAGDVPVGVRPGVVLTLAGSDGSIYLFTPETIRRREVGPNAIRADLEAGIWGVVRLPNPGEQLLLQEGTLIRVERLRFELRLRDGGLRPATLLDLAFNAGHPRFWGEAAVLESGVPGKPGETEFSHSEAARLVREFQAGLRCERSREAIVDVAARAGLLGPYELPYPLPETCRAAAALPVPATDEVAANDVPRYPIFLPVGMSEVVSDEEFSGPELLGDDGLDRLDAAASGWFQDDWLGQVAPSARALPGAAFDRSFVQERRLGGIHSLMFVDEVAMVAVPDAVHPDWSPTVRAEFPAPSPVVSEPPAPEPCPAPGPFLACPVPVPDKKDERQAEPEASNPLLPLAEPPPPADEPGAWDRLLEIQEAMVTLCQARADVVSVLSLPRHFERRDCAEWLGTFRANLGLPRRGTLSEEARELADLSYAAVYHPWLLISDADAPGRMRPTPAEGAVCGLIAAREMTRGVWVAPANLPLSGVLGLEPALSTDDWSALFDLGFNLIRPEPRDFRPMSAHTLSDGRLLLQVSVRRLLILLREVVAERGMDFVFESNQELFREGVRAVLEGLLRQMAEQGAFVDPTPGIGYQVVTDASVNPPEAVDQGRFTVELRVAPSQPAEFITVLLTRTGEGLVQVAEA